ncbi:MAG TPA: CHAT domain-containing tetratricopeptide repeat protein [Blastocatellia bacterium]|nr:CHAT domain-containing tetratricopeptide repeat protein [Blastocatellia bacterium]
MRNPGARLTLFPLIGLLVVAPLQEAFGYAIVFFQQSTQERHSEVSGTGGENDVRMLEPGKPQRRELEGGQRHTYRIKLAADQYLKAVIEQDGIDVVARLLRPDGKQIMEFDSESRLLGLETVEQVAETDGDYQMVVQPKQKAAPTGAYEIRIEEARAATDNDRALHEARKLYKKAGDLLIAGKHDEALPLFEWALKIRERILGPDHPDVSQAIGGLAVLHHHKGEYSKAEPFYQSALAIKEKSLGPEHLDVAMSLHSLASLYRSLGDYAKAEQLQQRALAIREKSLGPEHPDVAASLHNLANLYGSLGDYAKAEPLYQRGTAILQKSFGQEHPDVARSLNNLANIHMSLGDYAKAEPLQQSSLAILEKSLGPEHLDVTRSLNGLAILYRSMGDYAKAEPLYQRALAIREKALGPEHPDVAASLHNLANLHMNLGDYAKAEPLHQRALAILEKSLGPEHPDVAASLNNIANLYLDLGDYAKAELFHQRALAIWEKSLGQEHRNVAGSFHNIANIHMILGDYAKAELFYLRALAILEKSLGPEHPDVARTLNSLATIYTSMGDYAKAEPLHQRALAIREKSLGPEHPDVAIPLDGLARLHMAKNEIAQAVAFQSRAIDVIERNLMINLAIGSERQKLAYLATISGQTDRTLSLHLLYAPGDPATRSLAATLILQRKGRALDASSESLNALRIRFNQEDRAALDKLTDARSQIARLILDGPRRMNAERYRDRVKTLEEQAEKFEAEISRRSDEFRAQSLPVTLEAVRASIPDDAALIEFASYRPFNPKAAKEDEAFGQPHYVAYVLSRRGEVQWKELGAAKAVDETVATLRRALRDPHRKDVKNLARAVDRKVFQPLRPLLGGLTRLLISPEGALNLIPFAALVDEQGRYVVERYSISYLSSGRDLLRLQVARKSQSGPLVIADPDFGGRRQIDATRKLKQTKGPPENQVREESLATAFSQFYFPALPYTAGEGETIGALLPGATLLTKRRASKEALRQSQSPAILHIATHGFFLEDLKSSPAGERSLQKSSLDASRRLKQVKKDGSRIENPLLRAGLALAGANEQKKGGDGILTALEMSGLNLWGTKLVTLSACDTGVGEVRNGDGVHGLRRALTLAGAETQVMSLWAVSDRWTRELMVAYYRRLRQGQGRGAALRHAQLEMFKDVRRRHPYYWASFILSGEWSNLENDRGK